jgi:heme exporter protein B
MAVFFIIFFHEIKLLLTFPHKIYANLLFFAISTIVFLILAQGFIDKKFIIFYIMAIILFSLTSSLIFSNNEFLKEDFEDGTLEQIIAKLDNFEVFILAKILINWLFYALPTILFCPIIILMTGEKIDISNMLTCLIITSFAISFIASFCGSLSVIGNSSSIISIIIMPLIVPILLIGYDGIFNPSAAIIKILAGIAVLSATFAILATAKLVKIAGE